MKFFYLVALALFAFALSLGTKAEAGLFDGFRRQQVIVQNGGHCFNNQNQVIIQQRRGLFGLRRQQVIIQNGRGFNGFRNQNRVLVVPRSFNSFNRGNVFNIEIDD